MASQTIGIFFIGYMVTAVTVTLFVWTLGSSEELLSFAWGNY